MLNMTLVLIYQQILYKCYNQFGKQTVRPQVKTFTLSVLTNLVTTNVGVLILVYVISLLRFGSYSISTLYVISVYLS